MEYEELESTVYSSSDVYSNLLIYINNFCTFYLVYFNWRSYRNIIEEPF